MMYDVVQKIADVEFVIVGVKEDARFFLPGNGPGERIIIKIPKEKFYDSEINETELTINKIEFNENKPVLQPAAEPQYVQYDDTTYNETVHYGFKDPSSEYYYITDTPDQYDVDFKLIFDEIDNLKKIHKSLLET